MVTTLLNVRLFRAGLLMEKLVLADIKGPHECFTAYKQWTIQILKMVFNVLAHEAAYMPDGER